MQPDIEAFYPLTPLQQGILFHSLDAPDSPVYFEQMSCAIEGDFDEDAFHQAWQKAIDRHGILRTGFVWERVDAPVQVVHRSARISWDSLDCRGMDRAQRQERLEQHLQDDRNRGFDLLQPPLTRCAMIRMEDDVRQFIWSHHHILLDGWSVAILLDEVFRTYAAIRSGRPADLPPVRPFSDYIAWLHRQDSSAPREYWAALLKDFASPTDLGIRRQSDTDLSVQREERSLSVEVSTKLTALARKRRVTLNVVLQAAWALLLSRYSGSFDVVYGTVVSGRPPDLPGAESMLGLFINTLPVRVHIRSDDSMPAVMENMQRQLAEARQFEGTSLVDVQSWSRAPRGVPLFDSIFVFENYAVQPPAGKTSSVPSVLPRMRGLETAQRNNFPITGLARPSKQISLELSCHAGAVPPGFATRMADHWINLLEAIAAHPGAAASDLPMLKAEERYELVSGWNRTQSALPETTIHQMIESQAANTPGSTAVVFEGRRMSYRELNESANRWSHRLRSLGVGADSLVVIAAERSLELIIGLLAVLKAGAAYVPLDPTYPADRLSHMLADSGASILLTQSALLPNLPLFEGRALCLDSIDEISGMSERDLPNIAGPENLAYVIYTSGSTGSPKGAMNRHRAILNRLVWMQREYRLEAADRVLQKTPFTFDVSVWEFFWPLMFGATLVIAKPDGHKDTEYLGSLIDAEAITTIHFVPSMLRAFIENLEADRCLSLRRIICSGEVLPLDLSLSCLDRMPWAELHNLYGPTEAAVDVTYWRCDRSGRAVPIGRPIANTRIYILSREFAPAPVNASGELYIAGMSLARGYLNRPALTAEKFLPDPHGEPGSRMYRTGDLACWREDGAIEYLGRIDHQVKLRGFRIELGEIEAVIAQYAAVYQCVTVMVDRGDRSYICAYVVWRPGQSRSTAELRAHLAKKLPAYMIPAAFVALENLPLLASGKLDRKHLPPPVEISPSEAGTALTSAEERDLAAIWQSVLGVASAGPADNFFDLGGHSLLATRVAALIRETMRIQASVRDVMEAPALRDLAHRLRSRKRGAESPIPRAQRNGPVPLSFAQQRLWFLEQLQPGGAAYHIPMAVRLRGELDAAVLQRALGEIVRRHEALRTTFVSTSSGPVQQIHPYSGLPQPLLDVSGVAEGEAVARAVLAQEAVRPFDLERGPLVRAMLVRLSGEEHILGLMLHHIVSDGWSSNLLVTELCALYEAYQEGRPSPLPELELQYGDYAVWQREWLTEGRLAEELEYWRKQLGGVEQLALPVDRVRAGQPGLRGERVGFRLGRELTKELKRFSRENGATLFMTLLAGLQALLGRYTGQSDIAVGSPIANRTRREIEPLIGFFVNTLVLRSSLHGGPGLRELVGRVRETTLGAYAHQDMPFERLVEALQPERELNRHPLFQVMFAMQSGDSRPFRLTEIEMSPYDVGARFAKFDLNFTIDDAGDTLSGVLDYDCDVFEATTVERMLNHWWVLLERAIANPDCPIASIDLLHPDDRERLEGFARGPLRAPLEGRTIHGMVTAQARRIPDAIAVQCNSQIWTYAELERRADAFSTYLRSRAAVPETLYVVIANRTPEMLASMLAVLKVGGACVPIGPACSKEQIESLLRDSRTAAVWIDERCQDSTTPGIVEQCGLRGEATNREELSDENLAFLLHPSAPGEDAKGIAITHQSALTFLAGGDGRVFAAASGCFDPSLWDLFEPLIRGGLVALDIAASPDRSLSPIRPIAGTQVYVLDGTMHLCPIGIAGEIYVGGAGLSRGYLGRPADTAERFLPNPFGSSGSRLYRTGDLGRWNRQGWIDRVTRAAANGKIDREHLPAAGREREERSYRGPESAAERLLAGIWEKLLGVERIGVEDNFFELGGDSILSIQAVARAREGGLRLTPKQMFEQQTIRGLGKVGRWEKGQEEEEKRGAAAGEVAATPIQKWFWEEQGESGGREHFNQAVLLEGAGVRREALRAAVAGVLRQHDAVRLRWRRREGEWEQSYGTGEAGGLEVVDLSGVEEEERSKAIEGVCEAAQGGLRVEEGPLLRAVWMELGEGAGGRLLVVGHHLIVDGVSWRILLEDLQKGYGQAERGEGIELGRGSSTYQEWSRRLWEWGGGARVQGELAYWEGELGGGGGLKWGEGEGGGLAGEAREVRRGLGVERTRQLLQERGGAGGGQAQELLLAGLGRGLEPWMRGSGVVVEVEGHGREALGEGEAEELDVTRTVGWFTSLYPVVVEGWRGRGAGEVLEEMKERWRRVPGKGLGYGLLRYGGGEGEARLKRAGKAEISFNYLGQFDQALERGGQWKGAREGSGRAQSAEARRTHQLDIVAAVVGGRLQVSWYYAPRHMGEGEAEALADRYMEGVELLIAHCQAGGAAAYTPADFPNYGWSQSDLRDFEAAIERAAAQEV